jgi:hypothetical protein
VSFTEAGAERAKLGHAANYLELFYCDDKTISNCVLVKIRQFGTVFL